MVAPTFSNKFVQLLIKDINGKEMIEMSKMKEMKKLTLGSVQYVHDPEAAQKWFDLYIECVKEKMLQKLLKMMDKRILKI